MSRRLAAAEERPAKSSMRRVKVGVLGQGPPDPGLPCRLAQGTGQISNHSGALPRGCEDHRKLLHPNDGVYRHDSNRNASIGGESNKPPLTESRGGEDASPTSTKRPQRVKSGTIQYGREVPATRELLDIDVSAGRVQAIMVDTIT